MKLTLPEELRQIVSRSNTPVELEDGQTKRAYVLISAAQYEKMRRLFDAENIDPSFFEFKDEDFDSATGNDS